MSGTRNTSTRIVLEGEAEYRAALKNINQEYRLCKSELEKLDAAFKGQQNTLDALQQKYKVLNDMLGQAKQKLELEKQGIEQSQQNMDKYAVKLEEAKKKLEALQSTKTEFLTAEQAKKVDLYTNAVHNYTVEAERLKTREAEIRQAMDSSAGGAEKYRAELNACQIAIKVNNEHLEEYSKKLEDAKRGGEASAGSVKAYKDAVENAEKEVAKYEASHEAAKDALNRHSVAANKAEANVTRLEKELEQTGQYLDEAKNSADGCATSIDGMGKAAKDTGEKSEEMGQKTSDAMDALASALAAAGVMEALGKIKDALKACTDSSIEFESAMAGVAKTSDMSAAELDAMGQSILDMSKTIPMTTTELAGIAEVGGQLGIAKENLAGFTEVMAKLGTATNMTSEEAATMLAQFATVTGMDASLYSNLGSAIVDLGNNFATNEKKITDMAQSIAAAGTNAGMSEADMLALSAAVTSVGIEAGAGGTSMSTLIQKMQLAVETGNGLDEWAAAAGMSAQEFASLWGKDATGALTTFIQSLGTTEESAMSTLVALGLNDSRLVRMVTSLNSAEQKNHLLSNAIRTANTAWQENTALTNEAATRYATTESKMTLLQNASERLKIAIGNQLRPALAKAAEAGTDLLDWASDYVNANQELVPLVTAAVGAIGAFVGTLAVAAAGIKLAQTAMALLNATVAANPWVLAIAAVAAFGTAIAALALTSDNTVAELTADAGKLPAAFTNAKEQIAADSTEIEASAESARNLIQRLQDMESELGDAAHNTTEWKAVLTALTEVVPDLAGKIDMETGAIEGGTAALLENVNAWEKLAIQQAKQQALSDYLTAIVDAEKELFENQAALAKARAEHGPIYDNIILKEHELAQAQNELSMAMQEAKANGTWTPGMDPRAVPVLGEAAQKVDQLTQECNALKGANREAYTEVDNLTQAVADGEEKVEAAKEAYQGLSETIGDMGANADKSGNDVSEAVNAQVETFQNMAAELENLIAVQQAAKEAALQQIESTVHGFEQIAEIVPQSAKDTVEALQSQLVFMEQYGENMKAAQERGVSPEVIAALSDGTAQSAAILAGLATASDDEVANINESFGKISEGKDSLAEIMAAAQTDFETKAQAIQDKWNSTVEAMNQETAATQAGVETVQGLIAGINSSIPGLQDAVAQINAVLAGIKAPSIGLSLPRAATRTTVYTPNAQGLDYVPYDGYLAQLHEGERVLSRAAARASRAEDMANYGYMARWPMNTETYNNQNIVIHIHGGSREGNEDLVKKLKRELRHKGIVM